MLCCEMNAEVNNMHNLINKTGHIYICFDDTTGLLDFNFLFGNNYIAFSIGDDMQSDFNIYIRVTNTCYFVRFCIESDSM